MFLKTIDFYGSSYNFTLFKQPLYKTSTGGFFTILTIISFVLSFIFFSQDFYLRINPHYINQQILKESYPLYNFTEESNVLMVLGIQDFYGNLLIMDDCFNLTFSRHKSVKESNRTWSLIQHNLTTMDYSFV